jgi:hypothetical protein
MRPIQILLTVLLTGGAGLIFLSTRRAGALRRIVLALMVGVGLLMVLFPDQATRVAAWLGVGRGSDVVVYLAMVALAFVCLRLYVHQRQLLSDLTQLVRTYAIEHGHAPGSDARPPHDPAG